MIPTILLLALGGQARAQSAPATPLIDALSITVQYDTTTVARGSMRFRQVRTGTDLELLATGIVVRRGLRVTAELRTDSVFALRKYVAESRDSAGHRQRVKDRQVSHAHGQVWHHRTDPHRPRGARPQIELIHPLQHQPPS